MSNIILLTMNPKSIDIPKSKKNPLYFLLFLLFPLTATVQSAEPETIITENPPASFTPAEFTRELNAGWNWFSVNVIATDMSLGNLLGNLTLTNGDYIKSQSLSATYFDGFGWFGDLAELNVTKTYKIKLASAGVIMYEGEPANPEDHIFVLMTGWNWIGYVPDVRLPVEDALAVLAPAENDYLKDQAVSTTYFEGFGWFGDLKEMVPGEGYMFKSANTVKIVYPGGLSGYFTDTRDGNTYRYTTIGDQTWMAENLRWLPSVSPPGIGSETDPFFYVYGYDGTDVAAAKATANYNDYGVLYNWPATNHVCPAGWHVPADTEWQQLGDYISAAHGGYTKTIVGPRIEWEMVGDHLKSTSGWDGGWNGTDDYRFTALPGGYRVFISGTFELQGTSGSLWSATDYSATGAYGAYFSLDGVFGRLGYFKPLGFGVRCIAD